MTVLALDVGGSTVRGGLVSPDGEITTRHSVSTGDRDPGLRATLKMAEIMLDRAAERGLAVVAVGAGFPEYVDRDGLLTSHEVLDWERQPADLLADLAPSVAIDSDVRCGAAAELHHPTRRFDDFLYVSWGTGLSHTFVRDGQIHRGTRGEAIAIGELHVQRAGGAGGESLERHSSGAGIARRYAEQTGRPVPDGARSVLTWASQGDAVATEVVVSAGRALGTALAHVVGLLDPQAIILGGGLSTAEGMLINALQEQYAHDTARRPGAPPLATSTFGVDTGLIGAARVAWSVSKRQEGG